MSQIVNPRVKSSRVWRAPQVTVVLRTDDILNEILLTAVRRFFNSFLQDSRT